MFLVYLKVPSSYSCRGSTGWRLVPGPNLKRRRGDYVSERYPSIILHGLLLTNLNRKYSKTTANIIDSYAFYLREIYDTNIRNIIISLYLCDHSSVRPHVYFWLVQYMVFYYILKEIFTFFSKAAFSQINVNAKGRVPVLLHRIPSRRLENTDISIHLFRHCSQLEACGEVESLVALPSPGKKRMYSLEWEIGQAHDPIWIL
jgi:hypothetical protein